MLTYNQEVVSLNHTHTLSLSHAHTHGHTHSLMLAHSLTHTDTHSHINVQDFSGGGNTQITQYALKLRDAL